MLVRQLVPNHVLDQRDHWWSVFGSSAKGVDPAFVRTAAEIGLGLSERRIGILSGGARSGLMEASSEAALAAGGHVIGVMPEVLARTGIADDRLTHLAVTSDMETRKALLSNLANGFVVLPGGLGTLDEAFQVLTESQIGLHSKPTVFVNVNGYWDPIVDFVKRAHDSGFLSPKNARIPIFVSSTGEFFEVVDRCKVPSDSTPEFA